MEGMCQDIVQQEAVATSKWLIIGMYSYPSQHINTESFHTFVSMLMRQSIKYEEPLSLSDATISASGAG